MAQTSATAAWSRGAALLAGWALAAFGSARATTVVHDPSCGEMRVPLAANTVVYSLPHAFLRAGGDSIRLGGRTLFPGTDYVLDRLRGEIRLLQPPVPGETLVVRACWLLDPPPLELQLERYRPASPDSVPLPNQTSDAGRGSSRPGADRDPATAPPGTSILLTGNKTLAVEFGSNQDAFLRQSLDLAVSGTLAPGVELTGVLSDRNTPLTAAGTTQDLQSLDRVRIELRAPRGTAALGDVSLEVRHGEFARLDRRLQGVRGTVNAGATELEFAAASAPGEYHRLQFFGIDGRQGPYLLTGRNGESGVSIVAGSEIVTVDGVRMTRGESADYAIDYERARITFTNRRPISSASRITVEYQFAVNRYRRNLVAAGGSWTRGRAVLFTEALSESDDRGRPLDLTLDPTDRLQLSLAGDSTARAIGPGVTAGGGDYDTVRVGTELVYVFAGVDSGQFAVRFARIGEGLGDYADSSLVEGRSVYRFVGSGRGAHRVGRGLPLPENHQLWSAGGGVSLGPLAVEGEGAVSNFDRNSLSALDDGDNLGGAGRGVLRLEGRPFGDALGASGIALEGRAVGDRFVPFMTLERPFAEEEWGLPANADLTHQRKVELSGWIDPRAAGTLRARLGHLTTPGGFASWRRELEWRREGPIQTRARWLKSDGEQEGVRFGSGGRELVRGELRWALPWLTPALRVESDERRFPSDTALAGQRFREGAIELGSGSRLAWRGAVSVALRRDASREQGRFVDRSETRTTGFLVDSPADRPLVAGLSFQHREVAPLADPTRSRSDLGSLRLRLLEPRRGWTGNLNVEVTSEGENRRVRQVTFVGTGRGAYDSLGNYVGTGDYALEIVVSPELERVARAATSFGLARQFGASEAWRGSRIGFDFESETRRRGELEAFDPVVSPGTMRRDPELARGSLLQRLDLELAPDSRARAVRVRLERRILADRSYENWAQVTDERTASVRWRVRPGSATTVEVEGRERRQEGLQSLAGTGLSSRDLAESAVLGQLVWTPDTRLRLASVGEVRWTRPEDEPATTRTIRVGPDLGVSVGSRGRIELGARRSFTAGPPEPTLLPVVDPLGRARWEGNARLDVRVRETTTLGVSFDARDRVGKSALVTGRAELRAFF